MRLNFPIIVPHHVMEGIHRKQPAMRDAIVCGADSETYEGEPLTIQFHSHDQPDFTGIYFVKPRTSMQQFLRHLDRHCTAPYYRIYVHHLAFDMVEFFWAAKDKLITTDGAYEFTSGDWTISGVYGRPTFARLVRNKPRCVVELVDSLLWFKTSLSHAADMFCGDWPKLPRLEGLGTKRFTKKDALFVEYAMRDAEVCAHLGRIIEDMHAHFEIRPSISLASMAASVFTTHYVDRPIQQPEPDIIKAALCAYHGGKNNVRPSAAPAWHVGVNAYDLSSAYPFAMSELPGFTDVNAYSSFTFPARTRKFPDVGLYCISGIAEKCEWPALFDHGFKPLQGKFENVWVHGTELNSALSTGELKLRGSIQAHVYQARDESAMARFAKEFYDRKSTATDPVQRFMYKIVLNSLSGKFIQTREVHSFAADGSIIKSRLAGGLYHPFIAGAITAHTRAIMHRLEHAARALHTATDGIFCYGGMPDNDLPKTGLGSLAPEGSGDLALARNKLYVLYASGDQKQSGFPSSIFEGRRVLKYALHGFQGRLGDFERLLATNRRKYTVNKPNTLKVSLQRGLVPNKFETRSMVLKVGPLAVHSANDWS